MKFRLLFFLLFTIFFAGCTGSKYATGVIEINVHIGAPTGDVQPSYQLAVWLETENGENIKTLFLSEYLSYGGYNDSTICPEWSANSDWENAPEEEYDARTGATLLEGEHSLTFPLKEETIINGNYNLNIELHIIEDYNILYKGDIALGKENRVIDGELHFLPSTYQGTEHLLNVKSVEYRR